ncbi:MAG: pitrilysin family protein [Planctomycetota bacterium]
MSSARAPFRSREIVGEPLQRATLGGGLRLDVFPKEGWRKTYALLGTRFGGIDLDFRSSVNGRRNRVPAGVAHFLEHKMFEKKTGDVMDAFSRLGGSSNAMTGFHYTGYLVESTENTAACLDLLCDFVLDPWFTEALVEKEKGIIAEEIKMYRDDPAWRGFMGLLENLYGRHPVATDIAGTLESIAAIRATDLDLCYRSFYRPDNMFLVVAGRCDPNEVEDIASAVLARHGRDRDHTAVERFPRAAGGRPARRHRREKMPVQRPKFHLGWRIDGEALGASPMELEIALEMALGYLFGRGGPIFPALFREGLLDDSFGFEVYAESDYAFVIAAGDSPRPEEALKRVRAALEAALAGELDRGELRGMRRKMIGDFVRSFDSVSALCWNSFECFAKDADFADYGRATRKITNERVEELARRALVAEFSASHVLEPA